jgi:hypothetical protein
MKKAEAIHAALLEKRGETVEIEDIRSRTKLSVKFLDAVGATLELEWPHGVPHGVPFSRNSGCGKGEVRCYKITEAGRATLGLPAFGKESAFVRHWRESLKMSWGRAS